MPRGFLVKRTRRPTPISYRARCCYAEARPEALPLPSPPLPLALPRPGLPSSEGPPPFPGFGTPSSPPSPPAPLRSPARAVSEERRLPVGSPLSAESFPAPLLAHGAEVQLWAAISPPPPQPPPPQPPPPKRPQARKAKTARKLHFEDEVTTSPVLGLRIKEGPLEGQQQQPITSSSSSSSGPRAQPLGEFICQLCKERYPDPLSLAQHKCSRIVRVEYRCPECDKLFSCPANLASHRRWHKPRQAAAGKAKAAREEPAKGREGEQRESSPPSLAAAAVEEREDCAKHFRRQNAHHQEEQAAEDLSTDAEEGQQQQPPLPPSQQQQQQHPCPACGEAFPTKGGQERHLRLLHAAQAFPCKYCPATFYSSPGLTRHINKCHPSENRQVILLQVPLRPAC